MLNLCQFNLQLALVSACSLGKDFQDKSRPAQHTAFEIALQVSLLSRGQIFTKQNELGLLSFCYLSHFLEFPLTDERLGMRFAPSAVNMAHQL